MTVKYYLFFFLLWFVGLPVISQQKKHYVYFDRITIEHKLSNNNILSIEQDENGYLWFGTADGLNKYDGYVFNIYRKSFNDKNSISNNIIRTIYKDHNGTLWIGTENGLNKYIDSLDHFIRYMHDPDDPDGFLGKRINTIFEDSNHQLWIGTQNSGLNKYNPETNTFKHFLNDPIDPNSISSNNISNIYEDSNGNFWIGTYDNGINLFNINEKNFFRFKNDSADPHSISNNHISDIFETSDGQLYICSRNAINFIKKIESKNKIIFQRIRPNFLSTHNTWIKCMIEDNNRQLWIGAENGLLKFNPETKSILSYQDMNKSGLLKKYVVNDIFQDYTGIFWLGTHEKGLLKYDPKKQKFGHIRMIPGEKHSLSGNIITAIFESKDGSLWIGTRSNGLNYAPPGQNKNISQNLPDFINIKPSPLDTSTSGFNTILSIYEDQNEMIWLGTSSGLLNIKKSALKNTNYLNSSMLSNINGEKITDAVWKIYQDCKGIFWICTRYGLYSFDYYNNTKKPSITHYLNDKTDNSLSHTITWDVLEDSRKRIWVATSNGLNILDRKTGDFQVFYHDAADTTSIGSSSIKNIFEDSKKQIWITTEGGGLNRFIEETQTFIKYTKDDGLPNNTVWGILEDNTHNYWLSTNNGLTKFSPDKNLFTNYYASDGLQSNEFKMGAYYKGHDGRLYFGGINGFNAFYPSMIKIDPVPPKIYITNFRIFNNSVTIGKPFNGEILLNKSIQATDEITLTHNENFFSFEFAALHYSNPLKNRYAYKMEGFDKQWITTNAEKRFATYTNLPGGEYTFRVKACNTDGIWNHDGASINIRIIPPFYKTVWFYLLIVLGIILIIFLYIKIRERSIKREQRLLSNEQKLLQTLMDNIPDTIYFKDTNSRFTRVNQAKALEIGLDSPQDIIGKTDFDYFEEKDAREAYEDEKEIISTGKPLINKVEERTNRNGEKNWFLATKVPVKNQKGETTGTVGITRNITEQKQAELELDKAKKRAENADNLKSAFLANMSHEIRTPMNAILGFSKLLEDSSISEKERSSYIEYIRSNGQSLLNIINDIIDIAKIEAGEITTNKTQFDLHLVLNELNAFYKQEIDAKGLSNLELMLKKDSRKKEFNIYSDPLRIKQVLSNLISNALKFTDNGYIKFGYEIKNDDILEFFVIDTGLGIENDKLELIFERFRHFDNDFKKNISGTGLGLAISKKLIELLGGKIWVQSELQKGSSFFFTIPFKE